jgi:hypothetical protein
MTRRSRYVGLGLLLLLVLFLAVRIVPANHRRHPDLPFGQFAGYTWHGRVASVQASWTVPRILKGSSDGYAGTWIGAQARGKLEQFIQLGVNEDRLAHAGGRPSRNAYFTFWSDTTRHFQAQSLFFISPGDLVSASLALTHKRWTLAIVDTTSGAKARFSTSEDATASFNQAEWTQEDPGFPSEPAAYPSLTQPVFHRLTVNSKFPSYASLYSTWMSVNGGNLAPSPLQDDSFTLRLVTPSSAGEQYLRIVAPEDAAEDAFGAQFQHWTASTPYAQVEAATARYFSELHYYAQMLANAHWPTRVQGLVDSLVIKARTAPSRAPAVLTPSTLAAWKSAFFRQSALVSQAAHLVRRALNVPETAHVS